MELLQTIQSGDPFFYFLGASALLKMAVMKNWHNCKKPPNAKEVGKIASLHIFPVKSMKGIPVRQIRCTASGPVSHTGVQDRQWTVTTAEGLALTAKLAPQLNLITTAFSSDNVVLSAPGMQQLTLSTHMSPGDGSIAKTEIVGATVAGVDCGDEAADWLENFLQKKGAGYRLLYFASALPERGLTYGPKRLLSDVKKQDKILYHDESPFYLVGQKSVEDLNNRLDKKCVMANFRPNIVVEGCEAFAEDFWEEIYIGQVKFTNYMPCDRCSKSMVDQSTGTMRKDGEPLKTLRKYRMLTPELEGPCLGRMLLLDRAGTIKVGDPVYATTVPKFIG